VAPSTVLYWVRNFALKVYEKPEPQGAVVIELAEMRHFITSKKQMLDMEGVLRTVGQLVEWEVRGQKRRNAEQDAGKAARLDVEIFFADRWGAYAGFTLRYPIKRGTFNASRFG
jgi:hypothetical protein